MAKKLSGNGMWESSRFILPEHKEAYLEWELEQKKKPRRLPDEQEIALFSRILQESYNRRIAVQVKMYDPYEEMKVQGIVEAIDQRGRMFKVSGDWFDFDDVESIDDTDMYVD